jgi:hypothetical protein
MIIKTQEDGWDCVPELKEAIGELAMIDNYTYEIKNCVRSESLQNIVDGMLESLESAIQTLQDIDTSREYETVEG